MKHLSPHHDKPHSGKGEKADSHGSEQETGRIHGGKVAGAGELGAGDPGKMAMRVKPRMSGLPFEGGEESYSPKGMKKTDCGD